ncbi:MAG TPA: prolipoprotein diacylglyceryl transferase [Chloroflexota bacterium]|jgi:phosphatidylglycerol:prolipoprotein diacylglycerol transferase|nr:prolipoprotein diacylglyceryl transferase [Chloroflexota bacterium]
MLLLAIAINIDPNIAQIGPFVLSWHGLFSAIGVIAGVTIGVRVAAEAGANEEGAYNLALWSVAGGIVGARLFHVIDNWSYYAQNPGQIVLINEGGIAIYGAIIGGILTGFVYALRTKLDVAKVADGGAVGLILGQAIGRIGDVINGEHHGKPLDAPWAVVYTHPNTLGEIGVPVHLAVGYELVWDLLVFGLLWMMRGRVRDGVIFWTYIFLYGLGRFWITFYRYDTIQAFGLTQAQLIAVVGVVVAAIMLVKMLLIDRPRAPAPALDEAGEEDQAAPTPASTEP